MTKDCQTQIEDVMDELEKIVFQMSINGLDTYHLDVALSSLAMAVGDE